jgi:hypothetical protein
LSSRARPILRHGGRAGDFRHATLRRAPPHLHLPQPVLRHDVALREEQIVGGLRRDVRHAPCVAHDLDRRVQPGGADLPVDSARATALRSPADVGLPTETRHGVTLRHKAHNDHEEHK